MRLATVGRKMSRLVADEGEAHQKRVLLTLETEVRTWGRYRWLGVRVGE
jgi:hypothetical protein